MRPGRRIHRPAPGMRRLVRPALRPMPGGSRRGYRPSCRRAPPAPRGLWGPASGRAGSQQRVAGGRHTRWRTREANPPVRQHLRQPPRPWRTGQRQGHGTMCLANRTGRASPQACRHPADCRAPSRCLPPPVRRTRSSSAASMVTSLSSKMTVNRPSPSRPASEAASWLIPSIRSPSLANTQVRWSTTQ